MGEINLDNVLSVIGLMVATVSVAAGLISLVMYETIRRSEGKFWAKQENLCEQNMKSSSLTRPQEWCRQHNDGPDPCIATYPDVTPLDFSDGISLVVCRKGWI